MQNANTQADNHDFSLIAKELFNKIYSGIIILRPDKSSESLDDYIVSNANLTATSFFGKKLEDIIGKNPKDLLGIDFCIVPEHLIGAFQSEGSITSVLEMPFGDKLHYFEYRIFKINEQEVAVLFDDITENKELFNSSQRNLVTERLISYITGIALEGKDLDKIQAEIVAALGKSLKLSRSFFFLYDKNKNHIMLENEWVKDRASQSTEINKLCPMDDYGWLIGKLENNEVLTYSDVNDIESVNERNLFNAMGKKSVLISPIFCNARLYGFIGFDETDHYRKSVADDIYIYKTISGVLSQIITKNEMEKRLKESHARYESLTNELYREKEQLKTMLTSIGDAVIATDKMGKIILINNAAKKLTDWDIDESDNMSIKEVYNIFDEVTNKPLDNLIDEVIENQDTEGFKRYVLLKSRLGKEYYTTQSVAPIKDKNGEIFGIILTFRDLTEERKRQEQVKYLSMHDSLTGLYNRIYLESRYDVFYDPKMLPISIIMGDVNGLKITNDIFGHQEGDRLLVSISNILKSVCRPNDIAVRWGGDEFVVMLPNTTAKEVEAITNEIFKTCNEKANMLGENSGIFSISLGFATKEGRDEEFSHLIKKAEDFMYNRKLLESRSTHNAVIAYMKEILYEKSYETQQHALRIGEMCIDIGRALGLPESEINKLELFAMLHDIGKIAIDDTILVKPSSLNDEEFAQIKRHSEIGYRISQSTPELSQISEYILTHHERWDGKGYPQGLAGEDIPLLSRILAIADSFDAMTNDRIYRSAKSEFEAIKEIETNAGKQFDPNIVNAFMKIVKKTA